jgi:hypothetical protein
MGDTTPQIEPLPMDKLQSLQIRYGYALIYSVVNAAASDWILHHAIHRLAHSGLRGGAADVLDPVRYSGAQACPGPHDSTCDCLNAG